MSSRISAARRIVVKIGSSTLVDAETGEVRRAWFEPFAADIARLRRRGQEVLVVSSGAIALGRRALGFAPGSLRLDEAQAAAAVGQIALARAWSEGMLAFDIPVAQVLLTLGDTEMRRRYLNARSTLKTLLGLGVVPVINENDTVATEEIRFGDNDRLAARVASMCDADCLVLLSDVDGLYSADPKQDADAAFIAEVTVITPKLESSAGVGAGQLGSGGMKTKLMAARIAMEAGVHMAIANGAPPAPLLALEEQRMRATWFVAQLSPGAARKKWISGTLRPAGALVIDAGAAEALRNGKSLLPAGVVKVDGDFERGDCVRVLDAAGAEVARGLVAYGAQEANLLKGTRSSEIEAILGHGGRAEIIHRDDLVLARA